MSRILTQAQAEQDLLEIWLYTFNEWGEQQADIYLDDLSGAMALLAEQPLASRERLEFNPRYGSTITPIISLSTWSTMRESALYVCYMRAWS